MGKTVIQFEHIEKKNTKFEGDHGRFELHMKVKTTQNK